MAETPAVTYIPWPIAHTPAPLENGEPVAGRHPAEYLGPGVLHYIGSEFHLMAELNPNLSTPKTRIGLGVNWCIGTRISQAISRLVSKLMRIIFTSRRTFFWPGKSPLTARTRAPGWIVISLFTGSSTMMTRSVRSILRRSSWRCTAASALSIRRLRTVSS